MDVRPLIYSLLQHAMTKRRSASKESIRREKLSPHLISDGRLSSHANQLEIDETLQHH